MQKGKLVHDIAASDAVAALSVEKTHAQNFIFIHIEGKKKSHAIWNLSSPSFEHMNRSSWSHKLSLCSIFLYLCHCTLWTYTTSAFNTVFWQLVLQKLSPSVRTHNSTQKHLLTLLINYWVSKMFFKKRNIFALYFPDIFFSSRLTQSSSCGWFSSLRCCRTSVHVGDRDSVIVGSPQFRGAHRLSCSAHLYIQYIWIKRLKWTLLTLWSVIELW